MLVFEFEFQKFRILKILNFHPWVMHMLTFTLCWIQAQMLCFKSNFTGLFNPGVIKFKINQDFLIEHLCILHIRSNLLLL